MNDSQSRANVAIVFAFSTESLCRIHGSETRQALTWVPLHFKKGLAINACLRNGDARHVVCTLKDPIDPFPSYRVSYQSPGRQLSPLRNSAGKVPRPWPLLPALIGIISLPSSSALLDSTRPSCSWLAPRRRLEALLQICSSKDLPALADPHATHPTHSDTRSFTAGGDGSP